MKRPNRILPVRPQRGKERERRAAVSRATAATGISAGPAPAIDGFPFGRLSPQLRFGMIPANIRIRPGRQFQDNTAGLLGINSEFAMTTPVISTKTTENDRLRAEDRRSEENVDPAWTNYFNYGLRIRSQMLLPELRIDDSHTQSTEQVEILLGKVPRTLDGASRVAPWLQVSGDRCIIDGGDIARYQVEHGSRIIIDRRISANNENAVRKKDVRVYLLGIVFATLLHQRQYLPLHVSAVTTPVGVVGFTGPSGAGKSTIAAWLHYRRGFSLLTDDIGVINPSDALPLLHPGPPRVKLWDDAIHALNLNREGLVRDLTRVDKFHIPNVAEAPSDPAPLTHLIVLRRSSSINSYNLEKLHGIDAYRAVMRTVYRPGLNNLFYNQSRLHSDVAELARTIRVFSLDRPWDLGRMDSTLEQFCDSLGIVGGTY